MEKVKGFEGEMGREVGYLCDGGGWGEGEGLTAGMVRFAGSTCWRGRECVNVLIVSLC